MKINLKFTDKRIFKAIYVLIVAVNIIVLFFTYSFLNKNLYGSFVIDEDYLGNRTSASDLNINIFNSVIEKIEKKSQKNDVNGVKNIFSQ